MGINRWLLCVAISWSLEWISEVLAETGLIIFIRLMDQDQDKSHEESFALMDQNKSLVNLLTLPTELLVYIISFLSSLHDRVKLRCVSRWLRCVIEGTPSWWREFVWPYCDSREECSVKEMLKVCGQHIKVLSFPYSRVTSTRLVEMLQYCSNVQHLSLPSTKLDPEQLRMTIHHMGCLQTLGSLGKRW